MISIFASHDDGAPALAAAYDRVAATWHATICKFGFVKAYGDLLELASRRFLTENMSDLNVLDAGSGTAGFSLAFAQQIGRASFDLLDVSNEMLRKGAHTLAVEGLPSDQICCDIADLPARPKRYDVILSAHLIEHVGDVGAVLEALRAALSPGGVLILVVSKPHWCTTLVRLRWGHRAYRPAEMETLLSASGFEDIETFSFSAGPPKRLSAGYVAQTC
jgi:2-polyprenyl-3-methyl-5-hydroxy-6-metoxy-1,4-benzoquinol methylase